MRAGEEPARLVARSRRPPALIAAAHGLFLLEQRDLLEPYRRTAEFELLETFLGARGGARYAAAAPADDTDGDLHGRFARADERGFDCRQAGASSTFLRRLEQLKQQDGLGAWVTLVAMCHGLFHQQGNGAAVDEAYASLAEILAEGVPW